MAHTCRAVNLIHEVGRNLSEPRGHNDTAAIRYEHAGIATEASKRRQASGQKGVSCAASDWPLSSLSPTHGPQLAAFQMSSVCIGHDLFARSSGCTHPSMSGPFLGKCAGSRPICRGVKTDASERIGFVKVGCPASVSYAYYELQWVNEVLQCC